MRRFAAAAAAAVSSLLLLPIGLAVPGLAQPSGPAAGAGRVRLEAPLYTRGGAPGCTTTDALAGYFSSLSQGTGGVTVHGCLALQEGAAAELLAQDNGAYRIRVVHPGTGDIYPVELWTTAEGLRNAMAAPRQPNRR